MQNVLFRTFCACAFLLAITNVAVAAEPSLLRFQLSKAQNIRGLRVPLGMQGNSKPTMSVYFGKITIESKKAGFLRIGPIPQPVVSGMRLEIMEAGSGSAWGADFLKFAASEAALENVAIRGMEIRGPGKNSVTALADAAHFVPRNRTILLQGVQVQTEGKMLHQFANGEVYLDGEKAGRIEWSDGGQVRSVLLGTALPAVDPGTKSAAR